ncbi:class I SAM-dependent methyltransferase [Mucilaginibacter sp. UR6-11]|uniref:class I SAM-dependent methyltransferase n=1 Tax=Mucilaginibacter sp. UR6-11 TaxID=1435644 RepID=UPI001E43F9E6|nr:class I SAM-dependent methyltransferase [Mucilaginibacter sp. UR6-11]MCC8427130.1 class I SAM-dependent methyltransferase [Mucilaginibacter sp. UR6-11]
MAEDLQQLYGNIDIYLFDQLLKGTYQRCQKVLDIGCGGGRNLFYFLKNNYEVFGVDQNPGAINSVRLLSGALAPVNPATNFSVANADELPFEDAIFDLVISSAVLHFARDKSHFDAMVNAAFSVLKPKGYFFARLASDIGIESIVKDIGDGRYLLPDGSVRFLVNEKILLASTHRFGKLHEPIKTTNVQNLRCMTTWCVQKT